MDTVVDIPTGIQEVHCAMDILIKIVPFTKQIQVGESGQ